MTKLSEASMGFDAELVEPFLQRVARVTSGFGASQIAEIVLLVDELDLDEEREVQFEVEHEGEAMPLNVRVFMDDVGAPDLYFFAPPRLSAVLTKLMQEFCEERGI